MFTINKQWIKIYLGHAESVHEEVEAYHLDEDWVIKELGLCYYAKSSASWQATQGVFSSKH